jgi:ribonuclease HI
VIEALKKAVEYTRWKVEVYSDSELIINQINGEWRIKDDHLKDLHNQIITQITNFKEVKFFHVSRENKFIKEADKLCNECLDKTLGKNR